LTLASAIGGQKAGKKGRDTWRTPPPLVDSLIERFGTFGVDAAAQPGHAIKGTLGWFGPGHEDPNRQDALAPNLKWDMNCWVKRHGPIFLNPPFSMLGDPSYSSKIGFMHAAKYQSCLGVTIVALCPARISTAWFHNHVLWGAAEIWIPNKRLRFIDPVTGKRAGSPSAATLISVYRPNWVGQAVIRGCQMDPDGKITGWR